MAGQAQALVMRRRTFSLVSACPRHKRRAPMQVPAEPAYGEDCGVYRALGFVPLSENRSGRPRKKTAVKARNKGKP